MQSRRQDIRTSLRDRVYVFVYAVVPCLRNSLQSETKGGIRANLSADSDRDDIRNVGFLFSVTGQSSIYWCGNESFSVQWYSVEFSEHCRGWKRRGVSSPFGVLVRTNDSSGDECNSLYDNATSSRCIGSEVVEVSPTTVLEHMFLLSIVSLPLSGSLL